MKATIMICIASLLLASLFAHAKTGMLEGIFTSLPDAGFEKNILVRPLVEGNGKAEIDGEGYLVGSMSADDKLLLESYFFWEEGSLSKAHCLSFPTQRTTLIAEIAASNGDDATAVTTSYRTASAYLDKRNAETLFPLPKYKTRQVLCVSNEGKHFPQTSASIFFYNAQVGVIPMLKQ
ncbi:hypothetical protein [Enterovibrio norvegicus]|uniref:Uncharacterized protein n=1 Tax=Enterovibrio norvegicus DSM 15893 TaxID=1121869 RepID=A0A1I5XWX5_9GAMM|nr:hypothetical protein [Enterovibrio norvegicus]SFQ36448.1 hypothetical protein SAMN03084138_04871 [Enterovibrio norvegicus DSM 15893]